MTTRTPHHAGALSPEMAVLGLLYGGPGHGYDLHRRINAELGYVWHLSQSQMYAIVKRLCARGDLSIEEVPQERLPARQLLHISAPGRRRFLDWLEATSGGSTRAIRLEFVTRLYFLQMYLPEKIPAAFDRQRMEAQEQIERLEQVAAGLPAGQIYNRMSLQMRLKQLHLVLTWLDESQHHFF